MLTALRTVWSEPPAPGATAPRRWDWVLVGAILVAVVAEAALRPGLAHPAVSAAAVVLSAAAFPWRRSRPLVATVISIVAVTAARVVTSGAAPELVGTVVLIVLPYALARWAAGRAALLGLAALVAGSVAVELGYRTTVGDLVGAAVVLAGAVAAGMALRYRARLRSRELEQARAAERGRIARDLHDTVAHRLSAIAVRAQAGLAVAETRPAAAPEALQLIETEASRTLTEMREVVRALRADETPPPAPGPRLTELTELTEPGTGPDVDLTLDGDLDGVAGAVQTAVFRIVQEAVTNARRHASGATRVTVAVTGTTRTIGVQVGDDGDSSGRAAGPGRPGQLGFGLVGMAERAELLGGWCRWGPAPGGGWQVSAELPKGPAR